MQYLDNSDARLKFALQVTNSGIWEWNLQTGQVVWSENVEKLFGLSSGTSKGAYKGLLKRICSYDRRLVMRSLSHALHNKADYTIEFRINYPDGSIRWLSSQGEVSVDENGHPLKIIGLCRDITQHKQAEVAPCENAHQAEVAPCENAHQLEHQEIATESNICEQQLNHILNSLNDVVWSATVERFELTYLNPAAESIYGRPSREFLENPRLWLDAIHVEDRPQVEAKRQKLLESGCGEMEYRIVRPNGEIRWLCDRMQVIFDARGNPIRLDGIATDITHHEPIVTTIPQANQVVEVRRKERTTALEPVLEQLHSLGTNSGHLPSENGDIECNSTLARNRALIEQAEAVLERSEAKWRSLVEHSSDWMAIISADGTILYNSPAIECILGYSPEELVGQQGLNYISPQDAPTLKQAWKTLLNAEHGATLSPITFRALRKDGSWCVLEISGTNLLADEAVDGIAINARDATERMQVQEALQRSEVRFRAIFENAALGIALSNPCGELIACNPALHKMFGYGDQELRKLNITHPDDAAADFNLYQELLTGSICSYQMEKRYFHKNGNLVWGRLSVSLVRDDGGSPLFTVSMVEDITVTKKTEAELLRISKAVKNASDAIAIADTLLVHFTYLNPAFCLMFGYTLEQLNAAGGFSILFADSRIVHDVLTIAVSGQSWQGEVEMVTRSRLRKQIALRIDAIKDVKGEVVGTLAIHTDITERKQAESALRRSYERAELLKQITSEIRSSLDPQHIFQTTVTQLGEALSVNRCMIFLYQGVPQPNLSLVAEYIEPGYSSIEPFEVPVEGNPHVQQVLAGDRAIASTNVYAEPLLEPAIQLCHMMDIKSMLTVRTSYQGEPNGVLGLHQCDTYRYWTNSEIELLEAVAAQVGIALAHARLLEKEKSTAAQLAQQNKALQLSNSLANTKAAELEQALQDLQQTQAQLVQTEKMSSLGQLLAGVAHEINNPVSFITVNINYACDYIQDLLRAVNLYQQHFPKPAEDIEHELRAIDLDFIIKDLPKLLSSMKVGADRINQIVLSLRNFSRHDEVAMKSVDIHEGIDNTLMILRHRLKAKGGTPEIEVIKKYGRLPLVECYSGQLNQVFMNLISNAIDAVASRFANDALESQKSEEKEKDSQPDIGLKPMIEICTEAKDNNWAIIRIKDNGAGMTEEVKQKLFNPFFTTKPAGKGTGLGLSISYQIVVEKHEGNLQCISAPGQGTEFIIEIPIRHS
jgi:two-component system, NtrC family, sensor kinase